MAGFLDSIAENIKGASAELKLGNYPHGTSQILLSHSQQMEAAICDLVGKQEATALAAQLEEVHQIERLHGELGAQTPPEKERSLHVLDQTAGLFHATADFVRFSL